MTFITARLVQRASADGLVEVLEDVPLGREYRVDPTTRRIAGLYNVEQKVNHEKEIITCDDGTFFFTELLDLPKERSDA